MAPRRCLKSPTAHRAGGLGLGQMHPRQPLLRESVQRPVKLRRLVKRVYMEMRIGGPALASQVNIEPHLASGAALCPPRRVFFVRHLLTLRNPTSWVGGVSSRVGWKPAIQASMPSAMLAIPTEAELVANSVMGSRVQSKQPRAIVCPQRASPASETNVRQHDFLRSGADTTRPC